MGATPVPAEARAMSDTPDDLLGLLEDSVRLNEMQKSAPIRCCCSRCKGDVIFLSALAYVEHAHTNAVLAHPSSE